MRLRPFTALLALFLYLFEKQIRIIITHYCLVSWSQILNGLLFYWLLVLFWNLSSSHNCLHCAYIIKSIDECLVFIDRSSIQHAFEVLIEWHLQLHIVVVVSISHNITWGMGSPKERDPQRAFRQGGYIKIA